MRDRIQRFSALPFSIGCVSQSSVAVGKNTPRSAQTEPIPAIAGESQSSTAKMKSSFGLLPLPRPNISAGLQRLIRGFRSLSQLFAAYKEDEDDEVEMEMEIGLPTDVQHVAHIGWDGCNSVGSMKSWGGAPEFLPIPSLSFSQFELAMGAQADGPAAHVRGA